MKLDIASINDEDREFIVRYISRNWGSSVIVTRGKVHRTEELPGFVALMDREIKGIVTYNIYESDCEIVSLDNLSERCQKSRFQYLTIPHLDCRLATRYGNP
jgi:hypothetical protein